MSASPAIPALDGSIGAIQIGAVVGTFLFGIETLQAYMYFRDHPHDIHWLKAIVAIVWISELGHAISAWHAIYSVTVTFYCQLEHLADPPHSLEMTLLFYAIIFTLVQGFFAHRVRVVSGKWLIPIICWTLTFVRVIADLAIMGIEWRSPTLSVLQLRYKWLLTASLACGMTVDFVVAVAMCYWLQKIRGSAFKQTRRIADSLFVSAVETGVITSVASALELILFLVRNDYAWFPFYLVQGKLYSNSLLVSLNGRQRLREPLTRVNLSTSRTGSLGPPGQSHNSRGVVIEMSRVIDTSDAPFSKSIEGGQGLNIQ
ncbi:hypothetical protein DFH07DRAFT_789916 [Mycena maculata]|uniref:DUF6534 domain-containing protein n=1 Tax=Mycena maculata TaxID=230809 RepID=A0AAD7NZI8_9AGAR|nr:hypothetical protein DFH07DRAFT_789916 [Mycena maculata]